MPVREDLAFARLMGSLYTEVFQRRPSNPNKPLNRSSHHVDTQITTDDLLATEVTNTNLYVWGPGGASPFTNSSSLYGEWGPSITLATWG